MQRQQTSPSLNQRQLSKKQGTPSGADAAVDSSRPGFHLACTYRGHSNDVKGVVYNTENGTFTSVDEKGFKMWQPTGHMGDVDVIRDLQFPGLQGNYITCILYVESLQVFIAACLEGSLHVYASDMQLLVKMELPRSAWGAIVDMAYDAQTDELITAGATGVRVWYTEENFEEWDRKHEDLAEPPRFRGTTGPWVMGEYQTVRERMTLRVPGAKNLSTNTMTATSHNAAVAEADWVSKLKLHESSRNIFCIMGVSIYGYSLIDGVRCFEWEAIHTQPITDLIYLPQRNQVITSSLEPSTVIWRVVTSSGQVQRMRSFGSHTSGVTSICLHPKGQSVLTSSLDGMVVLWSMQSLEPIFRAKMNASVTQLQFFGEDDFMFVMGREVRVMWLQSIQTIFGEYSSSVKQLEYLGQNLVLAAFDDTSVRIISSATNETLVAIPPQLSSASLVSVSLSTWRSELYVILSNGQVHCWDIEMGKIPKLKLVRISLTQANLSQPFTILWPTDTHVSKFGTWMPDLCQDCLTPVLNPDMKFKIACLTILEGSLLRPQAGMELGLDVSDNMRVSDYLIAGTSDGDAQFIDLDKRGMLTCRLPVSKVAGISSIAVDALRARLISVSELVLQIWSLEKLGQCLTEIRLTEYPSIMKISNGLILLAGQTGALKSINMQEVNPKVSDTVGGHAGRVSGLEPNLLLGHFVTAGVDGRVKIFDWEKTLKLSLTLAARLSSVCWLNDRGDIISASGCTLYKISVETCYDAMRQQSLRNLYDLEKIQHLQATEVFAMRGSPLLDSLLVGLPSLMESQKIPSMRPPTAEAVNANIRAGSARRSASMARQVSRSLSRAGTPDDIPRYMLEGVDISRMQHWLPILNRMDMRLLVGQPSPPMPPEQLPLRTHQGLPGMKNFRMIPASSPGGLLKPLAPVDFREGTPAEMWRKAPQKLSTSALPLGAKSSSALETDESGKYIVMTPWGMEQTQKAPARREPQREAGTFANGISVELLRGRRDEMEQPSGSASRNNEQEDFSFATSSNADTSADEGDLSESCSYDSSSNALESGSDSGNEQAAIQDSEELPEGLEGGMQEAYRFICTQYDLSEEVVKKLMLEQEMIREMDGGGLAGEGKKQGKKLRRKKKKTPGSSHAAAALGKGRNALAGKLSEKPKKSKKRRKRRDRTRLLLGQDGVDYLRGVSKESGIITGCHEYNACEVKTLAANQSFLPKVLSPAIKHAKAPLGFRSRVEFPACSRRSP